MAFEFSLPQKQRTVLYLLPGPLSKWANFIDQARAGGTVAQVLNFAAGTLRKYSDKKATIGILTPACPISHFKFR
jgi:hypothetical protein